MFALTRRSALLGLTTLWWWRNVTGNITEVA